MPNKNSLRTYDFRIPKYFQIKRKVKDKEIQTNKNEFSNISTSSENISQDNKSTQTYPEKEKSESIISSSITTDSSIQQNIKNKSKHNISKKNTSNDIPLQKIHKMTRNKSHHKNPRYKLSSYSSSDEISPMEYNPKLWKRSSKYLYYPKDFYKRKIPYLMRYPYKYTMYDNPEYIYKYYPNDSLYSEENNGNPPRYKRR